MSFAGASQSMPSILLAWILFVEILLIHAHMGDLLTCPHCLDAVLCTHFHDGVEPFPETGNRILQDKTGGEPRI